MADGNEQFLDDNMDAVKWYYKRDDYHLTYYKVWEGKTKVCLEMNFELIEGTVVNIIDEYIVDKSEVVEKKIKKAIKDEEENN